MAYQAVVSGFLPLIIFYAATNRVTLKKKTNAISDKRLTNFQNILENEAGEYI